MSLPNPTPAEVAAVHAACAWFVKVEIFGFRYGSGNFMADRSEPGRAQAGGRGGRRAHLVAVLPDRD